MIRQIDIDQSNIDAARKVSDALGFLQQTTKGGIVISASNGSVTIDSSIMRTFVEFVRQAVSVEANAEVELSPQDAAERLRMSRPTVMRLISQGKLGARQVGSHYRLSETEVMRYKERQATIRRQGLDDLAAFSQEFDQ